MSTISVIILFGVLAIFTALYYGWLVTRVLPTQGVKDKQLEARLLQIHDAIAEGAMAFLSREYRYMAVFMVIFGVVIWVLVDAASAVAFLLGRRSRSSRVSSACESPLRATCARQWRRVVLCGRRLRWPFTRGR